MLPSPPPPTQYYLRNSANLETDGQTVSFSFYDGYIVHLPNLLPQLYKTWKQKDKLLLYSFNTYMSQC